MITIQPKPIESGKHNQRKQHLMRRQGHRRLLSLRLRSIQKGIFAARCSVIISVVASVQVRDVLVPSACHCYERSQIGASGNPREPGRGKFRGYRTGKHGIRRRGNRGVEGS